MKRFLGNWFLPEIEGLPYRRMGLDVLGAWFVRLRWLAVLGLLLVSVIAIELGIKLPIFPVSVIGIILITYNAIFYLLLKKLGREKDETNVGKFRAIINTQIILDLLAVAGLLHYTGGVENPFAVFFVFHIIIASIMLSRSEAFVYAGLASFLYFALGVLETALPGFHHHLVGFLVKEHSQNWKLVLA